MHYFYIKQGKMALPPEFKPVLQSNGRLALYKDLKTRDYDD